ncbi:hypothetical protein NPIL_438551 [Nephila pilipes]|uniref:Uncharacterized protein n=1 Tax=Nephila pilipes TaxID=299642 RepID=A0A8X6PPD3_NEPPI|nr:hypothetical protein NPIL_438551 [Nephila pilipes]
MSPDECNVKTSWVCVCKERECWSQVYFRVEYAPPTKVTRDVETSLFGRIQKTILLLVKVPLRAVYFEIGGWRGNCFDTLLAAKSKEVRGRFPLEHRRRGVHPGDTFPRETA